MAPYMGQLWKDRHGQENKAYSFDGVDDWIGINNFDWDDRASCTISLWTRYSYLPKDLGRTYGMFFGMNGEKHSLFIYGERLYFRQGGQNSFFEIPPLRKWHNFVLSWDALKRIVSYSTDGVQLAENTDYRENGLGSGTLKFGNSDIGYSYFSMAPSTTSAFTTVLYLPKLHFSIKWKVLPRTVSNFGKIIPGTE